MWAYLVAIVAIICAAVSAIDKHHSESSANNNVDLQKQVDRLETEVNSIKKKINEK